MSLETWLVVTLIAPIVILLPYFVSLPDTIDMGSARWTDGRWEDLPERQIRVLMPGDSPGPHRMGI